MHSINKTDFGGSERAQQGMALAAMARNLSPIPGPHMVGKRRLLHIVI